MSRQRQRRVNIVAETGKGSKDESTCEHFKEKEKRVMFMEEVDYKM